MTDKRNDLEYLEGDGNIALIFTLTHWKLPLPFLLEVF